MICSDCEGSGQRTAGCSIDQPLIAVRCLRCGGTGISSETRGCEGAGMAPATEVELIYWLLRAYQSGHREGWEPGPSTGETMERICDVLANVGYEPHSAKAKRLLSEGYRTMPSTTTT